MIAMGGKPLRLSGNARFALLDTSVRSHKIARPKPKISLRRDLVHHPIDLIARAT